MGKLFEIYCDLEFARESFDVEQGPSGEFLRRHLGWSAALILVLLGVAAGIVYMLAGPRHHDAAVESTDGVPPVSSNVLEAQLEDMSPEARERAYSGVMNGPSGLNRIPMANDDSYKAMQDTQLVVSAPGLLANDSDPDPRDILSVSIVDTTDTVGTVDYWNADGSFAYTPRPGHTGIDTFRYSITDGRLNSLVATVRFEVVKTASYGDARQP